MAPGEQGIATKESDMARQKLVWLQRSLKFWTGKAAKLKLNGEHETYK